MVATVKGDLSLVALTKSYGSFTAVQPLDQSQGLEIQRPDLVDTRLAIGRLHHLGNGFHHDAFL